MKKLDPVDWDYKDAISPDGRRELVGVREDTPVTLASGEKIYTRHTTLLTAADGSLMDADDPRLVSCQVCGTFPLHEDATRSCAECEATICLPCAARLPAPEEPGPEYVSQYLCPPCARHARRHALLTFFLSFQ